MAISAGETGGRSRLPFTEPTWEVPCPSLLASPLPRVSLDPPPLLGTPPNQGLATHSTLCPPPPTSPKAVLRALPCLPPPPALLPGDTRLQPQFLGCSRDPRLCDFGVAAPALAFALRGADFLHFLRVSVQMSPPERPLQAILWEASPRLHHRLPLPCLFPRSSCRLHFPPQALTSRGQATRAHSSAQHKRGCPLASDPQGLLVWLPAWGPFSPDTQDLQGQGEAQVQLAQGAARTHGCGPCSRRGS